MIERIQALNGRWYREDSGPWVPSVTTITDMYPKPELYRWYGNHTSYEAACSERDAAGERGTMIHTAIQDLINGQTVDVRGWESRPLKQLQGFINFWHEKNPVVHDLERMVTHYGFVPYAGQMDFVGEIDGEVWLIDWKSSSDVYPSHHIQTAAYANAFEIDTQTPIDRRGVLLLKSNTKKGWQLVESSRSQADDFRVFAALYHVYTHVNGYEPKLDTKEPLPEEMKL